MQNHSAVPRALAIALLAGSCLAGAAGAQTTPAPTQGATQGAAQGATQAGTQTAGARTGTNRDPAGGTDEIGAPSEADLAQRLFALGRQSRDPLLVIAAARLAMGSAPPTEAREPEKRPTGTPPAGAEAVGPDRDDMVAVARQMASASGDASLAALAQGLSAPTSRGRVGRGGFDRSWINTGETARYSAGMTFRGGELAEVGIRGGANARLRLSVYDENGNEVCASARSGSTQVCSWFPYWTGPFLVKVDNIGSYHTEYVIVTN